MFNSVQTKVLVHEWAAPIVSDLHDLGAYFHNLTLGDACLPSLPSLQKSVVQMRLLLHNDIITNAFSFQVTFSFFLLCFCLPWKQSISELQRKRTEKLCCSISFDSSMKVCSTILDVMRQLLLTYLKIIRPAITRAFPIFDGCLWRK